MDMTSIPKEGPVLAHSRNLKEIIDRQGGGLWLPLPAGTSITGTDTGDLTLMDDSKRIETEEGQENSSLKINDKFYIFYRDQSNNLALVELVSEGSSDLSGAIIKLNDAMVTLPVTFGKPFKSETPLDSSMFVRMLWANVPKDIRRDILAEQSLRDNMLTKPHAKAHVLLWLLGPLGFENLMARGKELGLACITGSGSSGYLMCSNIQRSGASNGGHHIQFILESRTPGDVKLRVCASYKKGGLAFLPRAMEFREIISSETEECPLDRDMANFAKSPFTFATDKLILCFMFSATQATIGEQLVPLFEEKGLPVGPVHANVWNCLPVDWKNSLSGIASQGRSGLHSFELKYGSKLTNAHNKLQNFHPFVMRVWDRWKERSLLSRLIEGFNKSSKSSMTMEPILLRSFRSFCISFAREINDFDDKPLTDLSRILGEINLK